MNLKIPQATGKGYIEVVPYGAFDWTYPNSLTRRGRVQGGVISALPYCVRMRFMCMKQIPFNPEPDGVSRTIKASYCKASRANFIRGGGMERLPLQCTIVGQIWKSRQNGMVYDPMGIAPCLCVGNHGGVEPKIIEYEKR